MYHSNNIILIIHETVFYFSSIVQHNNIKHFGGGIIFYHKYEPEMREYLFIIIFCMIQSTDDDFCFKLLSHVKIQRTITMQK